MLSVFQLSLPTPYPVGPVNVYLIHNKPLTLIDAGPNTAEARESLYESLDTLGVRITDIKRVVLTHSHPDHCGLAGWLSQVAAVQILTHSYEIRRMLKKSDQYRERMPFVLEAGLPAAKAEEVMAQRDKLSHPNLEEADVKLLKGGERLDFEGGSLQVFHLPGHAPGHLCLYAPGEGFFFSGDFLLPHITPNPIMEPDPENPSRRLPTLRQYLSGLQVIEDMDIKVVWPGHGGGFNDFKRVILRGRENHQQKFAQIKKVLGNGRKTCYEVTRSIYPGLKGWNIFMGISEIQAHLDYMLETGQVEGELGGGIMYYRSREVRRSCHC